MTSPLPLISVIIPAYNAEVFLTDAINSVLQQSYQNFEVLIIDDASTDNTSQVVKAFSDSRIIFLQQSQNQGASAARNLGINSAKGEYLAFLDADDLWSEDYLGIMLRYIQLTKVDLLFSHAMKSNFTEQRPYPINTADSATILLSLPEVFENPYMATCAMLVRKNLVDKIGAFDNRLNTAEDIDFVLRIAEHGQVAKLPLTLAKVRVRAGSLGNKASAYQDNLQVIDEFLQRHPAFAQQEKLRINRLLEEIYYCYLRQLIVDRNLRQFRTVTRNMAWRQFSGRSLILCLKALILQCGIK